MSNNQIAIDGYVIHRNDGAATQNKSGGGLIHYCRNSLNCSRHTDLEVSSLETIWADIEQPNARPFLVYIAYRSPNALSECGRALTHWYNKCIRRFYVIKF